MKPSDSVGQLFRDHRLHVVEITGAIADAPVDGFAVLGHSAPVGMFAQGVARILNLAVGDDGQAKVAAFLDRFA